MCLSDNSITGICYWLGFALAFHVIVWSAPEIKTSLELDVRAIAKVTALSLFWTAVSTGLGWLLIRFFRHGSEHCLSAFVLLLLAYVGSALFATGQEARKQALAKSGVDVFTRAKTRCAITGALIGMLFSAPVVFGLI